MPARVTVDAVAGSRRDPSGPAPVPSRAGAPDPIYSGPPVHGQGDTQWAHSQRRAARP